MISGLALRAFTFEKTIMKRQFAVIALALAAHAVSIGTIYALEQEAVTQTESIENQVERSWIRQALGWSQVRLAQLDANIAVLEEEASKLSGEARTQADAGLVELRKQRDTYMRRIHGVADNARNWSDDQMAEALQALDDDWAKFQATSNKHLEETKATIATRRALLQAELEAQQKIIAQLRGDVSKLATDQRALIDSRISELNTNLEDIKELIAKSSSEAWEATKNRYEEARQRYVEIYATILQFIDDADNNNSKDQE